MKLLISGSKQAGKSYLLNRLITEFHLKPVGYYSKELRNDRNERIGFAFCSYQGECKQFSYTGEDGLQHVIKGVFDDYATKILTSIRQDDILVIDEIGRLEQNETVFLEKLNYCFNSMPYVIAVLKKESLFYIDELRNRDDILYVDIDETGRTEAYRICKAYLKEGLYEKNNEVDAGNGINDHIGCL